jgi:penicillin-binding protein 2
MAYGDSINLNLSLRVNAMLSLIALAFTVIGVRLWYLQIILGEQFRELSDDNRLQTIFVPPPRGDIRDRDGELLVANRPSFNIEIIDEDTPNVKSTLTEFALVIGSSFEEVWAKYSNQKRRRKFEPKLLLKDVSRDIVACVSANIVRLPGVIITVLPSRRYLYGSLGAHTIGYIREISQKQLENPKYNGYRLGDVVGQYGLEATWESYLQGIRGQRRVIVNARGTRVGELSYEREVRGSTLTLSIDRVVQEAADKALATQKGAIVALDATNGEVLALSSSFTFDPSIFASELTPTIWRDLMEGKKLTNRALQGVYPPGSVFKIFTGIAALSEGVMTLNDKVHCNGGYFFAGRRYGCWKKSGHGTVSFKSALIQSCDVYFYIAGQRLGVDRIHKYASLYGLGRKTGINLPDEASGLIPSTRWKARAFRKADDRKWYPGETLSVAIGQGANSVTPLQVARAVAAVVNGGILHTPRLVTKVISPAGTLLFDDSEAIVEDRFEISPEVIAAVNEAHYGVVNAGGGTARKAQLPKEIPVTVGGKTGTAQVAALKHGIKGDLNDHAWFAGYAPTDKPEIVVVALAENGGHGGSAAAPLVREVMKAYFAKKLGIVINGSETE